MPGILKALEECSELNLTPAGVSSLTKYFSSFTAVLMSAIWIKVLVPIDSITKSFKAEKYQLMLRRKILKNLSGLHDQWSSILREAKLVAREMNMVILLGSTFKQRKPIRGPGGSSDRNSIDHAKFRTQSLQDHSSYHYVIV